VRTVMGMPGVRTGLWLVFTSVWMAWSYDGEGCTCEKGYGDAGCEDRSLARVTSVGMSRMIASYDGEGCTCENSDGDARCEDRSLACVHQCVDGLTCSKVTT
jgi:hypothetical protein